jgi:hypothetical protein
MIDGNGSRRGFWNENPKIASTRRSVDLRASVKSGTKGTLRFVSWVLRRYAIRMIFSMNLVFLSSSGHEQELSYPVQALAGFNLPHIIHSCPALGSKLMACSRNVLNDVPQRGHLLLQICIPLAIDEINSQVIYLPLFPGPQTTRTFFPLLSG